MTYLYVHLRICVPLYMLIVERPLSAKAQIPTPL